MNGVRRDCRVCVCVQVGEFAFILLSVANQYALLPSQVYMLMMGECELSLSCHFTSGGFAGNEEKRAL